LQLQSVTKVAQQNITMDATPEGAFIAYLAEGYDPQFGADGKTVLQYLNQFARNLGR
jgi:hypothetical protein